MTKLINRLPRIDNRSDAELVLMLKYFHLLRLKTIPVYQNCTPPTVNKTL